MECTRLLSVAVALSLVASLGSGSVSGRPDAMSSGVADRSFPLQAIARASDSQPADLFGQSVAVSGNAAIVGALGEDGGSGDPKLAAGAAYVFQRHKNGASQWGQVQRLTASDAGDDDRFGYSAAISGQFAIVGAPYEDGGPGDPVYHAGAAYVFRRDEGGASNWGEVEKLTAPDPEAFDEFGHSVAISGDTAVVGAHFDNGIGGLMGDAGAAYIFQNVSGFGWLYIKTIRPGNSEIGDHFGESVAISGDRVIVGADSEDGGSGDLLPQAGTAYIFSRDQGGTNNWGEVEQLVALDTEAQDSFGFSVAIWGNLAVVGAPGEDGGPGDPISRAGAAYIFQYLPGPGWTQIKKLQATDAGIDDSLGWSVAISGGVVLAGAYSEDGGAGDPLPEAGAAYAYLRHLGGMNAWGQATKLTAPDAQAVDNFGFSVALSGSDAIVGSFIEDGGLGDPVPDAGAAYIFYVSLLEAFRGN